MAIITNESYRKKIEAETDGFHKFGGRNVRVGERRVFVYPHWGTPDAHPDYTAHRFHVVTVESLDHEASNEGEPMFRVRAEDGWTGSAWASELFPLPRSHR